MYKYVNLKMEHEEAKSVKTDDAKLQGLRWIFQSCQPVAGCSGEHILSTFGVFFCFGRIIFYYKCVLKGVK